MHILNINQDSRGLLWLGAVEGLFRFDGVRTQVVQIHDSLLRNPVRSLFEHQGNMWVGFENGAIAHVPINSNFLPALSGDAFENQWDAPAMQVWKLQEGLPEQQINGFAADPSGALWFATYGEGLYVYKKGHLYQFNADDDGLASDDIYAIACDKNGQIWAATDNGISICSISEQEEKKVINLGKAEGLPDEIIRVLLPAPDGTMWIGTDEKGVCSYNQARQQCTTILTKGWAYGRIVGLQRFGNQELWIATENKGLFCYEIGASRLTSLAAENPEVLLKPTNLFKDREGLLWVLNDKGRLYNANVRFGQADQAPPNVQALLSDHQNRIWIGAQNGLFIREKGQIRKISTPAHNILSIWESPDHSAIWVGTFGDGVLILDQNARLVRHIREIEGIPNGSILSIGGNAQQVWLATLGGVTFSDLAQGLPRGNWRKQGELGSSYVYKIFSDTQGRVWFGTDGKGLAVLESGAMRFYTELNGKRLKTVYSIVEDHKNRIWFSTEKEGLFCLDGAQNRVYQTQDLMHSARISGLATDGNGHILIGYEDGFDILNPERVNHFMFCDEAIGAPPARVNLNALCTDAHGNVWIGTDKGIVRSAAFQEPFIDDPVPGISAISIFLKSIDYQGNKYFSYDQNYFIFNFMGLWLTNPEAVRYRYRLEGFDPDWKFSKDHLASYPNLPPGSYVFRMQSSEHGNFENAPEISWAFTIAPPFWKRWWFVSLALMLVAGMLYFLIRSREQRLNREAQLEREKVASQFETLKSQINPHFLFNSFNTLITIIEENPKMAVEYLEHLSDFYRNIMAYREKDFISLQEECEVVNSFYFLLKKRFESGLVLENHLNGQTGQIMPLALQLLVENAVKHNVISTSRPLHIEIFVENNSYIVVRNNIQKKIKPEPSTHFGLQSLINRYALIGESPVVVDAGEKYFTVKIPLKPCQELSSETKSQL